MQPIQEEKIKSEQKYFLEINIKKQKTKNMQLEKTAVTFSFDF